MRRWLEERRDVLMRELVEQFLEQAHAFEGLWERVRSGRLRFADLDAWVGNELRKGPLWRLKDRCHLLLRDQAGQRGLWEYLFDWTVGSIFHEAMKAKEASYQLEAYRLEHARFEEDGETLREYGHILERAEEALCEGFERMAFLFARAKLQLRRLLPLYGSNGLLIRMLLERQELAERVLGPLPELFAQVYPGGWREALLRAAQSYRDGGWVQEARALLRRLLEEDPEDREAQEMLRSLG